MKVDAALETFQGHVTGLLRRMLLRRSSSIRSRSPRGSERGGEWPCVVQPSPKYAYATMIAVQEADELRFVVEGFSTANARTEPTISIFRSLLPMLNEIDERSRTLQPIRQAVIIQYDDFAHYNIGSVAYCRRRDEAPAVTLIPDSFFFESKGYQDIRDAVLGGKLPRWEDRQDQLFWRGAPTNNGTSLDGSSIERLEQIPRVRLCLALRQHPRADVGILGAWGLQFPAECVVERLIAEGIFRSRVPMIEHGNYRYLIDIDGVGNAWSFFEKLLLGACVLKVRSPFEQWFYDRIAEWKHFVPVQQDLSDLFDKFEWCQQYQGEAKAIGECGQDFAMKHTYEIARQVALDAIRHSAVRL